MPLLDRIAVAWQKLNNKLPLEITPSTPIHWISNTKNISLVG